MKIEKNIGVNNVSDKEKKRSKNPVPIAIGTKIQNPKYKN